MRKIKFRGKAKMSIEELNEMHLEHENGWVYGHLVMYGKTPYIVGDFIEVDSEYTVNEFWVSVHHESIGQYTELKDRHGKEIYEGDIVKYPLQSFKDTWVVDFHNGSFIVKQKFVRICMRELAHKQNLQVISNIYENPELL